MQTLWLNPLFCRMPKFLDPVACQYAQLWETSADRGAVRGGPGGVSNIPCSSALLVLLGSSLGNGEF